MKSEIRNPKSKVTLAAAVSGFRFLLFAF